MYSLRGTPPIFMASIPCYTHAFSSNIPLELQAVKQLPSGCLCFYILQTLQIQWLSSPHIFCYSFSPVGFLLVAPRSLGLVLRALNSCVEFENLRTPKPHHRMLLDPERAAPFRTRDLALSPNETFAVGKDIPEWPHIPVLYDTHSCCQSQDLICLSAVGGEMAWAELLALLAFTAAAAAHPNWGLKGSSREDMPFLWLIFREKCSLLDWWVPGL